MMWRLLASVLPMATTGQAGPITKLSSNGWWDVWYDASNRDGNPMCVISNLPALIAVAVGAMAEPKYPAPVTSVFEQSKHDWVQIDGAVEHFRQSGLQKNSN